MDLQALQLCSRFAIQPNGLGYCGLPSAQQRFLNCLNHQDCEKVEQEITNFIVLNPYLETIAKATGKSKFSYQVIESYWYGNELLEQITTKDYQLLLKNLAKQGVPSFLIEEITTKPLNQFIPIHLFNILFVGVGKASGSVPFTLASINNCMVRWGKVIAFDQTYQVEAVVLDSSHQLVSTVQEIHPANSLITDLAIGDTVALHWGGIADRPTPQQLANLQHWTARLLNSL